MKVLSREMKVLDTNWRRKMVLVLASEGQNQQSIADTLRFSLTTIERDIKYWKKTLGITDWLDELLPFEYRKALISYDSQIEELWNVIRNPSTDSRTKVAAISVMSNIIEKRVNMIASKDTLKRTIIFVTKLKQKYKDNPNEISQV